MSMKLRNLQVVPPETAAQLVALERTRTAAGVAGVGETAPLDEDDERFCACGNLLRPGAQACGECEPVGEMYARYQGAWRLGLVGYRL
jgi:hypothetical protein